MAGGLVVTVRDAGKLLGVATARGVARDHGFGFNDILTVTAALEAGCDGLLGEELQDGRAFGVLRIVKSFSSRTVKVHQGF